MSATGEQPLNQPSKRRRFFGQPPVVRLGVYLPLVGLVFFFAVRWLEAQITHHPTRYAPGAEWAPPANAEDLWFTARDGVKLNGWLIRARTERAGTVLYCHGNGGNLTNVEWVAEELAAQGLDVLIFDYRGYGRSDGDVPDEQELYSDADAAYDFLTKERGVKPEELAVYGLSLGTTAAIDLASRRKCGALVVEAGLSSASDMAGVAAPWLPAWLHWVGRNRFESARKIADVKCPLLVTHGTDDEVIPVAQGRRLYDVARGPKKLIIVKGGDHWLPDSPGMNYLAEVGAFIRAALTRPQPDSNSHPQQPKP
jgi:uncharacterized protein